MEMHSVFSLILTATLFGAGADQTATQIFESPTDLPAQGKIDEVDRDVRGWRVYSQADIDRIRTYANKIESPKERSSEPEARRA